MSSTDPQQPDSPDHDLGNLDPRSYTARRLEHASAEHLNLTTRRFFVGPIPEGWLNSNRKAWYRKSLKQREQRSKTASFKAQATTTHQRAGTGLEGASAATRTGFSFPQPADAHEYGFRGSSAAVSNAADTDDRHEDVIRHIDPLATDNGPAPLSGETPITGDTQVSKIVPTPGEQRAPATSNDTANNLEVESEILLGTSVGHDTFVTARQRFDSDETTPVSSQNPPECTSGAVSNLEQQSMVDDLPSSLYPDGSQSDANNVTGETSFYPVQESSTTELLPPADRRANLKGSTASQQPLAVYHPFPLADGESQPTSLPRQDTQGVRFALAEGVSSGQERLKRKIGGVQARATSAKRRRNTLRNGTVVKMEKMLVRVEITKQTLSEDYDENAGMGTQTRLQHKWQEFMVVLRQSKLDEADLRVQMYKSRVVPEIENEQTKKKPRHEIELNPRKTKVNLYSSLDKTVVLWHPYKKGTRIMIMRPRSTAHSVEWYTLLKDTLGWKRPSALQVNVPDLNVSLRLEKPFEGFETARRKSIGNLEDAAALAQATAEEQAVATKLIRQCFAMLVSDSEWADVLDGWSKTEKMGLVWKRYDRLEWIYGANERKMYGSMALQKSHELELRPKKHYPTTTQDIHQKALEEPAPVEGFLVRLTTQEGVRARFGKTPFKRLYFSTHNQFLHFNQPSKITPPPPPRLPTISGSNIPSSSQIMNASPTMFEITPYKVHGGAISWIKDTPAVVRDHDRKAFGESQRNLDNISLCDGFINLCRVVKVREMRWGAASIDDELNSGSDVDFHQNVTDTTGQDGTTSKIDDSRTFELVMDNGLIVRLQAYDSATMKEWIRRLRALVKYWKLRTVSDMDVFKMIRRANLQNLNVDEEMEALIGQFGSKWEVSRCQASAQLYNICGISSCRPIVMSGTLYRKPRRHASFARCSVILANGALMMFQASRRTMSGKQVPYTHQEKENFLDLSDCYIYSGLITENNLLYANRTFDSNKPGNYSLPRVYLEHGWTSTDEDTMTCFVIWHGLKRSFFRARHTTADGGTTQRLTRVSRLGTPGRGIVFQCRSRAERDHWVINIGMEIDRLQRGEDVRLEHQA